MADNGSIKARYRFEMLKEVNKGAGSDGWK